MSLSFRPVRTADLPRCQALLSRLGPTVYPPDVFEALPGLWARLIAERRLELHVFEDTARPPEKRIFCLASGVFVAPDFAARLREEPVRFVAREVYRRELAGDSVILTPAAVARANPDPGLDAIGLDYAVENLRWTDVSGLRVLPLIPESLRVWLGGYALNSLHRELFEAETKLLVRAAGMRRRKAARASARGREAAGGLRPALYGLTRAEAMAAPGTAASLHFVHGDPIFAFTPAQQELLRLAVLGQSDAELAESLDISLSTVKKHWQAVFERVAAVGPDWHPRDGSDGGLDGTRGAEKRRPLLHYLRQHLEELRPRA